MNEIRMCRFLPANFGCCLKKKTIFLFGGHLEKKREKGQEKREIYSREISSVLILSLLAFLINSRTNERRNEKYDKSFNRKGGKRPTLSRTRGVVLR